MRLAPPLQGSLPALFAWAKRLVDDLNRSSELEGLPVFADDASAAAGRVAAGGHYVTPEGVVRRRMA